MANQRDFHRSLPAKRMGSGAIIRDDASHILVVNPTYKDTWELPGGVVEADESPAAACRRELLEELGITPRILRMLCVDYNPSTPDYLESLMFLFETEPLTGEQVSAITLDEAELSDLRFCEPAEAGNLLGHRVSRRLAAVLEGATPGIYLEDQEPLI